MFYRQEDRSLFIFGGLAFAKQYKNETPVQVTWGFKEEIDTHSEVLPGEVAQPEKYIEGATKTISVNMYERNPLARKACIDTYGFACSICDFDFYKEYGEIGKGFIHVHHLKPLADIGEVYELNPTSNLRPVCPNCHAMLHIRTPAFSIEELRKIRDLASVNAINCTGV